MLRKFVFIFLIVFQLAGLLHGAIKDTPTYDEPANMAAAFDYVWRGDFRIYPDNPPLVKILAGIFLFPVKERINFPIHLEIYTKPDKFDLYAFGREFVFHKENPTRQIIFLTRLPNIIITMSLGFLIYLLMSKIAGPKAAFCAFFFYSLDPNIRGHGKILAFDIPLAFFSLLLAFLIFQFIESIKKNEAKGKILIRTMLISFVFGLAFLTKFTAVFVYVIFFALLFVYSLISKGFCRWFAGLFIAVTASIFLSIWVFALFFPGYGNDRGFDYAQLPIIASADRELAGDLKWKVFSALPLPHYYKTGLKVMYTHNLISQPSFLLGEVRGKNDWFYYFPVSFILKTPLPTLLFIGISLFLIFKALFRKIKEHERYIYFFAFAVAFMFLMMLFSNINNVYRYLFPALVFFIAGAGGVWVGYLKNAKLKLVLGVLAVWLVLTSVLSFPFDLSYTNDFTGVPPKGIKFLSDSEIDWGQDLERLALWLKSQNLADKEIALSYLGTADPAWYGISYKPLKFEDLDKLSGIVAISAGNLTLGDWQWTSREDYKIGLAGAPLDALRQRKPDKMIGKSIFVYELPYIDEP